MRIALKYFFRVFFTGAVAFGFTMTTLSTLLPRGIASPVLVTCLAALFFYWFSALNHWRRVHLVAPVIDSASFANRQVRQIELPVPADEAFDLVERTLRDTQGFSNIEVNRVSGQLRARLGRQDLTGPRGAFQEVLYSLDIKQSQVLAILSPREGATSIKLICEPAGGLLAELFMFDGGSNAVTTDAIARRLAADIGAIRRDERAATVAAATQKEVAEARLSVLEAQVEPHFLYNTLGSAKYLIKSDPVRAEAMLDNLIVYLRKSLPKTEESVSSLGEELQRARAYLEIMQIRMGERLALNIDVPGEFASQPFPNMMLQTLVENAIKHGLEPKSAGGTIWIRARHDATPAGPSLLVTVADDGLGMNDAQSGTGIGHRNIRERLRLLYDDRADFSLTANFPTGLAATIRVPVLPVAGATP